MPSPVNSLQDLLLAWALAREILGYCLVGRPAQDSTLPERPTKLVEFQTTVRNRNAEPERADSCLRQLTPLIDVLISIQSLENNASRSPGAASARRRR
jgi:hypothetical protein